MFWPKSVIVPAISFLSRGSAVETARARGKQKESIDIINYNVRDETALRSDELALASLHRKVA